MSGADESAVGERRYGSTKCATPRRKRNLAIMPRHLRPTGSAKEVAACHTPFRERGNEASIRVPRMFKSHV
jgi:hypothetical protein